MENKFVIYDKHTKKIEEDIEISLKRGYNDLGGETISSSEITQCDRRMYYSMIDFQNVGSRNKVLHESYMVSKWCDILRQGSIIDILEKEFLVADRNFNICSTIDIVGKMLETPVVIKIREINNEDYASKIAKRPHVIEIMVQMWLAEINDGFLIYENSLTKEYNVFHILPNASVLNAVKSKLLKLIDNKNMGILPERKYEASSANECKKCVFVGRCWS
jgi:hypothetical protein